MNFVNQLQTTPTASMTVATTSSSNSATTVSSSSAKDQAYSNEGSQSKNQNTWRVGQ